MPKITQPSGAGQNLVYNTCIKQHIQLVTFEGLVSAKKWVFALAERGQTGAAAFGNRTPRLAVLQSQSGELQMEVCGESLMRKIIVELR